MEEMNNVYLSRDGKEIPVPDSNNRLLERLFSTCPGRLLMKALTGPLYSNLQRAVMNSFVSSFYIGRFVRTNRIRLKDYEKKKYCSFHDFFLRRIRPEVRPLSLGEDILMCPCDAKAMVYPIDEARSFLIKGVPYTVEELVCSQEVAKMFAGGTFLLLRLCVEDYHHYHYPVSGIKTEDIDLPGRLHTVHPIIHRYEKVYRENSRSYSMIYTKKNVPVLMMEVGALGVGRIVNDTPGLAAVTQGAEKGHFEFGGSTVLLLVPKDSYEIDPRLLRHTEQGYETIVKMGEYLGREKDS